MCDEILRFTQDDNHRDLMGNGNYPDVRVSLNPRRFAARKDFWCIWGLAGCTARQSPDTPKAVAAEGDGKSLHMD